MGRGKDKNFFGANTTVPARIRGAWEGRISGCLLGKPLEVLSFREGREGLESYLQEAGAVPLRDYVPALEGTLVELGAGIAAGDAHVPVIGHEILARVEGDIRFGRPARR